MKSLKYEDLPKDWALCLKEGCRQSEGCLRHMCHVSLPRQLKTHVCVMPQACEGEDRCPMFVSSEPVVLAWGMARMLTGVPEKQARAVRTDLFRLFGDRRRYYRFREGRWVIGPAMQTAIAEVLRRHGIAGAPRFDRTMRTLYFPDRTDYIFPAEAEACDTRVTGPDLPTFEGVTPVSQVDMSDN